MGMPLSEAASRRRRRQRHRVAAFAFAEAFGGGGGGSGVHGSSGGVQDPYASAGVPGGSGGGGGCCGGGLSGDDGDGVHAVRQQVVVALRCLAGALELQGYDWGLFGSQQAWTEDITFAAKGDSHGAFGVTSAKEKGVLTGHAAEPTGAEAFGGLCVEPSGDRGRAVCETVSASTQTACTAEFFECEEELLPSAEPTFAAGLGIVSEVGNGAMAVCCKEADHEAIASAMVLLPWCGDDLQEVGAIASTMVGLPWCGEDAGSTTSFSDPGVGCFAIPAVDAEETVRGAMLLGEIQKKRRQKGKRTSPCAIPAGAARTACPTEASGSDLFAEVGKHGSAASSVGDGAGPFLQVSRQAAPGREDSAPGFGPEIEVLDEVLTAMDVPMGHRAEPKVVGALWPSLPSLATR